MTKTGLELELLVTDKQGKIVNRADDILDHPDCSKRLEKESTYGVIELVSDPYDNLSDLDNMMRKDLKDLTAIAESLGLMVIPISDIGPEGNNKRRYDKTRYKINSKIWGTEKTATYNTICGTHIHVDKSKDDVAQYNLFESIDPIFALLSTSPFIQGKNTLNACRVNAYRNNVFKDFPLHGQLTDYIADRSQRDFQDELRYNTWINMSGLHKDEAKDHYAPDNTCWGPLRTRPYTTEARGNDTNILSNIMAMTAMYKGINDYVFSNQLEVKVGNTAKVTGSEMIIPSYMSLKAMEDQAIRYGLKSEDIRGYLSHLLDIADCGLANEEKAYLSPFKEMIKAKTNMADMIKRKAISYGHNKGDILDKDIAYSLNRDYYDLFQKDLNKSISFNDILNN